MGVSYRSMDILFLSRRKFKKNTCRNAIFKKGILPEETQKKQHRLNQTMLFLTNLTNFFVNTPCRWRALML